MQLSQHVGLGWWLEDTGYGGWSPGVWAGSPGGGCCPWSLGRLPWRGPPRAWQLVPEAGWFWQQPGMGGGSCHTRKVCFPVCQAIVGICLPWVSLAFAKEGWEAGSLLLWDLKPEFRFSFEALSSLDYILHLKEKEISGLVTLLEVISGTRCHQTGRRFTQGMQVVGAQLVLKDVCQERLYTLLGGMRGMI